MSILVIKPTSIMAKKKKAVKAKKKAAAPKKKVAKKAVKKAKAVTPAKKKAVAKKPARPKKRPRPKKKKTTSEFEFDSGAYKTTRLVLGEVNGSGYLKIIDMKTRDVTFLAFEPGDNLVLSIDNNKVVKATTTVSLSTAPAIKTADVDVVASTLVTENGHLKGNLSIGGNFDESLQGIVSMEWTGNDTVAIGIVHQDDDKDND